jgi:hypothetical protein
MRRTAVHPGTIADRPDRLKHAAKLEAELLVTVACGRLPGTLLGHSPPLRNLSSCFSWRPRRDSNPCYRRERATARRREERGTARRRGKAGAPVSLVASIVRVGSFDAPELQELASRSAGDVVIDP